MDRDMKRIIRQLGFDRDLQDIPSLKVTRHQFSKKSLLNILTNQQVIKELLDAYNKIVRHIKADCKGDEEEPEVEDKEALERNISRSLLSMEISRGNMFCRVEYDYTTGCLI